jgi:plastocyanin domain-containing protein
MTQRGATLAARCAVYVVWSALVLRALGCRDADGDAAGGRAAPQHPDGRGRISIAITATGFVPRETHVHVGEPVTLVVTRLVEDTCAKDLVLEQFGVVAPLPLGQPVEVRFTPLDPGRFRFSCVIDAVPGEIVVE